MVWILAGIAVWFVLSVVLALLVGRAIKLADEHERSNR